MTNQPNASLLTRRQLLLGGSALGLGWALWPRLGLAAPPKRYLRMRTSSIEDTLNLAVAGADWWAGASVWKYDNEQYDEIRLKPMTDGGYLTYISGEGREDFSTEQVIRTVWGNQDKLDQKMSGCVAAERLGTGTDSQVGTEYADLYMLLDFGVFYGEFFQRMFKYELDDGRVLMCFEKLFPSMIDSGTWARYQEVRRATFAKADDKGEIRGMFNKRVEVSETYGVFIADKGKRQASRISMVAKIGFGDGSGFLAQMGSKMPLVIKAGLQSGFDASVAIAKDVKSGRYK